MEGVVLNGAIWMADGCQPYMLMLGVLAAIAFLNVFCTGGLWAIARR